MKLYNDTSNQVCGTNDGRQRVRPDHVYLGTDAEGSIHHWDLNTDAVHVIQNGERIYRQPLAGRSVDGWVDHISTKRGWDDIQYGPEAAQRALQEAVEQIEAARKAREEAA